MPNPWKPARDVLSDLMALEGLIINLPSEPRTSHYTVVDSEAFRRVREAADALLRAGGLNYEPLPPAESTFARLVRLRMETRKNHKHWGPLNSDVEAMGGLLGLFEHLKRDVFFDFDSKSTLQNLIRLAATCEEAAEDIYDLPLRDLAETTDQRDSA